MYCEKDCCDENLPFRSTRATLPAVGGEAGVGELLVDATLLLGPPSEGTAIREDQGPSPVGYRLALFECRWLHRGGQVWVP